VSRTVRRLVIIATDSAFDKTLSAANRRGAAIATVVQAAMFG
jgi:hypothetical protein